MHKELDHHSALIHTMVLVSASEVRMSDRELNAMGRLVRDLPVFRNFDPDRIVEVGVLKVADEVANRRDR